MGTGRAAVVLLGVALCPLGGAGGAVVDSVVEIEASGDRYPEGEPGAHGWLRIAPRWTYRLSPRVLLTAAPVLEVDSHGDLDRGRLYDDADRDPRRSPLRFERLSLRLDLGRLQIEIGKQPLTWGRTDAINPTDNLTPRDWTDPLHEVRLAPWAARFHFEKRRWEAELALVPRYAPSRLPRLGGRWLSLEPIRVANPLFPAAGPPELEVDLELVDPRFPGTTLDHLQAGARLGRRGGRTEWALSYYRGFDDAPRFDVSLGDVEPATGTLLVILTPRFPRLEVLGADGVLLAGAWALRAEAGHFRFPRGLDRSFLLYEVDAEWTRGAWRLVAGYADLSGGRGGDGFGVPDGARGTGPLEAGLLETGPAAAGNLSLDLGFLPAAFFHLGRSLATEWEASVEATVGTDGGDGLVRLSGSWPARDGLRLGAELDLVYGESGSFFGAWRDNDRLRLFARLTY